MLIGNPPGFVEPEATSWARLGGARRLLYDRRRGKSDFGDTPSSQQGHDEQGTFEKLCRDIFRQRKYEQKKRGTIVSASTISGRAWQKVVSIFKCDGTAA